MMKIWGLQVKGLQMPCQIDLISIVLILQVGGFIQRQLYQNSFLQFLTILQLHGVEESQINVGLSPYFCFYLFVFIHLHTSKSTRSIGTQIWSVPTFIILLLSTRLSPIHHILKEILSKDNLCSPLICSFLQMKPPTY